MFNYATGAAFSKGATTDDQEVKNTFLDQGRRLENGKTAKAIRKAFERLGLDV